ncbi:meiotic W68 [Brevipalpus obovatus]|uniref:meiotic W68 n=1 Tax=Brevipalpus obovatus TaxID=246614 RepID=UPI003D9EE261
MELSCLPNFAEAHYGYREDGELQSDGQALYGPRDDGEFQSDGQVWYGPRDDEESQSDGQVWCVPRNDEEFQSDGQASYEPRNDEEFQSDGHIFYVTRDDEEIQTSIQYAMHTVDRDLEKNEPENMIQTDPFHNLHDPYSIDDSYRKVDQLRQDLINSKCIPEKPQPFWKVRTVCCSFAKSREECLKTVESYFHKFHSDKNLPIGSMSRKSWDNVSFKPDRGIYIHDQKKTYTFMRERRRNQFILMLGHILNNLQMNKSATKRDLFYREKKIYKTQKVCDNIIEDICTFTRLSRESLHVLACGKGLVYGDLRLIVDGKTEDCSTFPSGYPLPYDLSSITDISSNAKFILVIEKDASFQSLIRSGIKNKFQMILLTGKGFPDKNTRQFLRMMVECLSIPAFMMVDCDPWGIEIACVFKYGSLAMAHTSDLINTTHLRWIGILPEETLQPDFWGITQEHLTDLSDKDDKKITELMNRKYIMESPDWKKQVEIMFSSKKKVDLQQMELLGSQFIVERYLPKKLKEGHWV